ncbi:serine hydrolase domain-containing protein [Paenibacillus arenilitoris]|uniref:Serine hydrolase n=1 Tax=Paenibacillus arenilitoris TaxID=2772299 RepID=A0A927CNX7_9BACL|nr:serine hydrolase [Paenibacillus arenilitoris]MBD2869276.1 serine hydrolase [Paenibacillus arenilitoris]
MERTSLRLPRSVPEAQGISSAAVIDFLKAIQERELELHSLMLLRHGQVVAEGWWAPYAPHLPHMLFSLSKSFTSSAIGFAAAEGKLTLDDAVVSYFPEEVPEEADPNLAAMTIRHLLMMGTGHDKDTLSLLQQREDGNWAKAFLSAPVEHVPGTHFVYNSGATYMLSAILQKASGQTLLDYLRPRLLEPLGIEGATWESCPRGVHTGGWGLSVATEDIAKFGQLYLQKGVWNGKQLLSEAWIEEATSKQIANGDGGESDWAQGYGYQFWRCRHGLYRGDGAFGQFCIVMPERDAVLAITSGTNDMQGVMNAAWEHLLPPMASSPLAPDLELQAELNAALQELALRPPGLRPISPAEAVVGGKAYQLEDNAYQWESVSVSFEADKAIVAIGKANGEHRLTAGRGEWAEGASRLLNDAADACVVASFTWPEENTLELTTRYIETPFAFTSRIRFEDEGERIEMINLSNVMPEQPAIRGLETRE